MAGHPNPVLLPAFRRYADTIPVPAGELLALIEAVEADPSGWGWARLLAAWPRWTPHRLPRLLLPTPDAVEPLAARCRTAAAQPDAPTGLRTLFNKSPGTDLRGLLQDCADLLAALAPQPPAEAALDRAADVAHEIETHLRRLPDDWAPARLARAAPRFDQLAAALDGSPSVEAMTNLLDELARDDLPADQLDATLLVARAWAEVLGRAVLPAAYSFTNGCEVPDDAAVKLVFRRDGVPSRVVRVRAFGLSGVRPGEVVVSAGPPPHGLAELEELAEGGPDVGREELRDALRALRPAGAGGYLELAAIDLFTRFWDRVHPAWAGVNPSAAGGFGAALAAMLTETFGIGSFAPQHVRDYPDGWVVLPPAARMTTGRVVRVLRPGLAAGEELRVPARVEVE